MPVSKKLSVKAKLGKCRVPVEKVIDRFFNLWKQAPSLTLNIPKKCNGTTLKVYY